MYPPAQWQPEPPRPEEPELSVEQERVHQWRLDELLRAGYPPVTAKWLADDDRVDLHTAVELLEHGCPLATARRILTVG